MLPMFKRTCSISRPCTTSNTLLLLEVLARDCVVRIGRFLKNSKALYVFNASQDTYEDWAEEIFNHLDRTNREWQAILEWVQVQPTDTELSYGALTCTTISGMRAWDLSTTLDTFLMSWVCKGIKKRRKVLSGGVKGNGFELWRQLFHEYKGTGQMSKNAGRRKFTNFGRCNDLSKLSQHLDEWLDQLEEFAPELLRCPEQLRSMVDEVIPESIETELLNHEDVVTYRDVIAFCKRRTYHLKQKSLVKSSKGKVNALAGAGEATEKPVPVDDDLEPPSWAKSIIAALSGPPAPHSAVRPPRGRLTDKKKRDGSAGSRGSSRGSSRDSSMKRLQRKFIFRGGCNHCGVEGHKRQDCAEFKAIKAKHNGQLPQGYKGARERAFDKWFAEYKAKKNGDDKAKLKAKKGQVKALTVQPDSSDSDFTDDEAPPAFVCTVSSPKARPNSWEPVTKGTPMARAFATPIRTRNPLVKDENFWRKLIDRDQRKAPTNFTVRNERDLDAMLEEHPMICSLPKDEKSKVNLSKLTPKDAQYVYIMMDSGASLHAGDLEKHFPGHLLTITEESLRGDFACTANGDKLYNMGKFAVRGSCNGVSVVLNFTNMKVDVPVASVRTFVRSGNDVEFFEGGGIVRNRENGAKLPFIEMGGVYFLQLKIKPPKNSKWADEMNMDSPEPVNKSLFARPGP